MKKHRIYSMSFASVYPHYVTKAEKKGRTKEDVDERYLSLDNKYIIEYNRGNEVFNKGAKTRLPE